MNQAKILEPDYRMCVCCGGWFIKIDNDTLRFYELPSDCNIDLNTETLPIEVELNWEKDKNDCLDGEIYISIDDVIENSNIFSKSFNDEFARILIHGILHLLGYDDKTKIQKDKMSQLENHYLSLLDYNLISII